MIDARGVDTIGAGLSALLQARRSIPQAAPPTRRSTFQVVVRERSGVNGNSLYRAMENFAMRRHPDGARGRSWGDGVCRHAVYITRSLCLSISVPIMGSSIGLAWGGALPPEEQAALSFRGSCRSAGRSRSVRRRHAQIILHTRRWV